LTGDLSGVRPPTFSQRYGYEPYPPPLQLHDLDQRTRTDLWNYLYSLYFDVNYSPIDLSAVWTVFLGKYRHNYRESNVQPALLEIVGGEPINRVFDLIEYLMWLSQKEMATGYASIAESLNFFFALNRVGYRLNATEAVIVPITDEHEMQAVETAASSELPEVRQHLRAAVQLFADRDNPQWAKSVGESISAVEAAAREVSGNAAATLEKALDEIKRSGKVDLHPALIAGWQKLYAFAGDSGGIRHALKVGTLTPTQAMAQYFLVTCSAFVNLLAAI
jgi:AbiJ N-terminal domain 4